MITEKVYNSRKGALLLAQRIIESDPVFFDTETTGTSNESEVVEVSVINLDGKVLFDELIRPNGPYPRSVQDITGISEGMLSTRPSIVSYWERLRSVFKARHLCAYNAVFDMRLLQQSVRQLRAIQYPYIPYYSVTDCMLLLSNWLCIPGKYDSFKWVKLGEAAHYMQVIPPADLHRAHADAETLRMLLLELVKHDAKEETIYAD